MADWWENDPVASATASGAATGADWWKKDPVKPPVNVMGEVTAPFAGFNKGFDAILNLPGAALNLAGADKSINYIAGQMGYAPPLPNGFGVKVATQANADYEPQTLAGRASETIGEVAGASVLPEIGMIAKAASMTPQALRTAAPILERIAAQGPVKTVQDAIAPVVGAGVGTQAAREADLGPLGEVAGGLLGGYAGPNLANIGGRAAATFQGVKNYTGRQFARAGDPQLAADQDTVDALLKAGVQPEQLFPEFAPTPSGQLQARGITNEKLADMVARYSSGDPVEQIARENGIGESTLQGYLREHKAAHPTPRNVADVTQDLTNVGAASPVLRLGRTAFGIADEGEAAGALTQRQNDQYGRTVNIIRQAAKGRDYEQTLADLDETLGTKSKAAYGTAHQNEQSFDLAPALSSQRKVAFESAGDIKTGLEKAIDLFFEPVMTEKGNVRKLGQPIRDVKRYQGAREALDYMIEQSKNAQGKATTLTRKLTGLRRAVNGTVREANPLLASADDQFSGAKSTQELLKRGEQLTTQLGSKTDDFFKDFQSLAPEQREIVRLAFLRKLENKAAKPQEGAAVANQFRSNEVKKTIRRLFGPERPKAGISEVDLKAIRARNKDNRALGENLISRGTREATTTHTLNAITNRGNTQTAPWMRDMQQAQEGAELVGDVMTGNAPGLLRRVGRKLAAQIGERTSKAILDNLTNTAPEDVIPKIRRWVQLAKTAEDRNKYIITLREFAKAMRQPGVDIGTVVAPTGQERNKLLMNQ